MLTNLLEIGESIYAILTIEQRTEVSKDLNKETFRSLLQFAVVKLLLQLFLIGCLWIVIKTKNFLRSADVLEIVA